MTNLDMSDLANFKRMLDRAGLTWAEQTKAEWRFLLPGLRRRDRGVATLMVATVVTAEGKFYDDLQAAFDEDGGLIDMVSHVCLGSPSKRAKELYDSQTDFVCGRCGDASGKPHDTCECSCHTVHKYCPEKVT